MSESQEDHSFFDYQVPNALLYKEFDYDQSEWDNIPTILPRFITFMSKHIEALTEKCNERFTQISTPALQSDFESKLTEISDKLDDSNKSNKEEQQKLSDRMSKLEADIDSMLKQSREDNRRKYQECRENLILKTKMNNLSDGDSKEVDGGDNDGLKMDDLTDVVNENDSHKEKQQQ